MEENNFFKWIWRINGLGIFIGVLAFCYFFYVNEIRRNHRAESREIITSLAKDPKGLEKWVLEAGHNIESSDYTLLSLVSENNKVKTLNQVSSFRKFPYYSDSAKNILFINTKKNNFSWLFKGNNQLILRYSSSLSYYNRGEREKAHSEFIYYEVVDSDTNHDNVITKSDKPNFSVSTISGKKYTVIIKEIEKIITMKMIDKDTLHMVYQKEGKGYSLKLDIESFNVLSNALLPKVSE
jgi:hypothetical protein